MQNIHYQNMQINKKYNKVIAYHIVYQCLITQTTRILPMKKLEQTIKKWKETKKIAVDKKNEGVNKIIIGVKKQKWT